MPLAPTRTATVSSPGVKDKLEILEYPPPPPAVVALSVSSERPPPPPPMTSIVFRDVQLVGTVNVLPPVVVMNPRHCPPPMSVKTTLLPVPQVIARAVAGKKKSSPSDESTSARRKRKLKNFFIR